MDGQHPDQTPIAYLLTFACYGQRLHGNPEGTVDEDHNAFGAPFLPSDPDRRKFEQELMDQNPYSLDQARREAVRDQMIEVCDYRSWALHAVHVRKTHAHVVVTGDRDPERMLNDLKAYASRSLNDHGFDHADRKRWAYHGSTIYLWQPDEVQNAIRYVLHEQGNPMETFLHPDLRDLGFESYDNRKNRRLRQYFDSLDNS